MSHELPLDPNAKPKKGRGCWLYGCLITLIVLVVGALALYLGIRHFVTKAVVSYTDTAPAKLPEVVVTQADIDEAQKRCDEFFTAVKTDKPLAALVLSEKDLNALVASTGKGGLKDQVVIQIDGDQIKAQTSMPLDKFGVGALRGRFLNATVRLKVTFEDGTLVVKPESIEAKDHPLPGWIMSKMKAQNWAQGLMNNMESVAVLQNLEEVVVTNGSLTIKPKAP